MPAEARGRCLALLLLLIPAIAVHGTPSISRFDRSIGSSFDPAFEINLSSQMNGLSETARPTLARIGREILSPPSEFSARPSLSGKAKSLPGVPAGIFMVLAGFLCVSFVNDRKIWLASLAGILWLGQTGLTAIPQAASNIIARKNSAQHSPNSVVGAGRAEGGARLRSDVEGTQYIALLRHLAGIPALISSSIPASLSSLRPTQSPLRAPGSNAVGNHLAQSLKCALAGYTSNTTSLTACSACAAERAVRFSPGFVFSNLARGPPQFD